MMQGAHMERSYQDILVNIFKRKAYKDANGCLLQVDQNDDCLWGTTPHGLVTFMIEFSKIKSATNAVSDIWQFLEFWDVPRNELGQRLFCDEINRTLSMEI